MDGERENKTKIKTDDIPKLKQIAINAKIMGSSFADG